MLTSPACCPDCSMLSSIRTSIRNVSSTNHAILPEGFVVASGASGSKCESTEVLASATEVEHLHASCFGLCPFMTTSHHCSLYSLMVQYLWRLAASSADVFLELSEGTLETKVRHRQEFPQCRCLSPRPWNWSLGKMPQRVEMLLLLSTVEKGLRPDMILKAISRCDQAGHQKISHLGLKIARRLVRQEHLAACRTSMTTSCAPLGIK